MFPPVANVHVAPLAGMSVIWYPGYEANIEETVIVEIVADPEIVATE
jgi:hypothetical protein